MCELCLLWWFVKPGMRMWFLCILHCRQKIRNWCLHVHRPESEKYGIPILLVVLCLHKLCFGSAFQGLIFIFGILLCDICFASCRQLRQFKRCDLEQTLARQGIWNTQRHCICVVSQVVLATNIAETYITIDDCTVVVDTGRVKEMRYDANRRVGILAQVGGRL